MLPSKRFLLAVSLASVIPSCPSLVASPNAASQESDKTSGSNLLVRRFRLQNLALFVRVSAEEIEQRLAQNGLLPLVERPYDQAKVALIKDQIIAIYKEHGVAVVAESFLRPTSSPGYVEVVVEVRKQG
jgi:hypothetical protein